MLNKLISIKLKNRIKLIREEFENPIEYQSRLLKNHIQFASKTIFGKKYNFQNIKTYLDFNHSVPIWDYDKIKPYIELAQKGEADVLWPGKVKWFAKSSGTTQNKSKLIPITQESLKECHFKAGRDMLSLYLNQYPKSNILKGKSLMIGGSTDINKTQKSYIGDLSAIIIQNLPTWVQIKRSPSIKTALTSDWEHKIRKIIKETKNQNITSISGVPSWTIVIMNKIMESHNITCLSEIWPNIELYMHGGINFECYKADFSNYIKKKTLNYLELYNASEGFFGIQNDLKTHDLLLLVNHGIFYEFIPIKNGKEQKTQIIPLEAVKVNTTYAMVITTNGGLWRYKIGDTVTFTSLHPYKIKINGRTQSYINAFGEELNEQNANNAINKTCLQTNSTIKEYVAGPFFYQNKSGAHEWFIEFQKAPKSIEEFKCLLDDNIQKLNSDYQAKRTKNILLQPPIIHVVGKNFFYNILKDQNKIGGQNKIQRLHNNRNFTSQLIEKL